MKTFRSLNQSPISLKAEKEHLTFALYRNSQDIKRIVSAIIKIKNKSNKLGNLHKDDY